MAMVLVINVAEEEEEEIMEMINNALEIQHITTIQTNECKLIRKIKSICNKKTSGCICVYV
jgi:hypothetical protein